jgi:hypothetical protein
MEILGAYLRKMHMLNRRKIYQKPPCLLQMLIEHLASNEKVSICITSKPRGL